MARIEGICRDVMEKTEWIAIATTGADGPHVVATWGNYVQALGIEGDTILIPVGAMRKTEENLKHDARVELLCGTRQVQGAHGPGKGCSIIGKAQMVSSGPAFDLVKTRFVWARAALIVKSETVAAQL